MSESEFSVEILDEVLADVAVDGPLEELPLEWQRTLDRFGVRLVAPIEPRGRTRVAEAEAIDWLKGCSGLLRHSAHGGSPFSSAAQACGMPGLQFGSIESPPQSALAEFAEKVLAWPCSRRAFAFFVGRLERDFDHAREALRATVEREAGIDLLWSGDNLHSTSVAGVRESTQLLLRYARFVVADLSLGIENPQAENPSRAHEIGMSLAYERPVLLCSQEPRRYPYFSVADMQMNFWSDERDLAKIVQRWLGPRLHLRRCILNHRLPDPRIAARVFQYDPGNRFIGPHLERAEQDKAR